MFQGVTLVLFPCKAGCEVVILWGLQVLLRAMEGLSLNGFEKKTGTKTGGTCVTKELEEAQTMASDTHQQRRFYRLRKLLHGVADMWHSLIMLAIGSFTIELALFGLSTHSKTSMRQWMWCKT